MMYEDVIKDFAARTRTNLSAIEKLKKEGAEVFETTQLVNSCLGLLVFPRELYIDRIPETPLEVLAKEGWPPPKVTAGMPQAQNLKQLIRYLRNAIAHCNLEFIDDGQNVISFLHVWNKNNKGEKTWEAELSVDDLKKIAEKFSAMLIHFDSPTTR